METLWGIWYFSRICEECLKTSKSTSKKETTTVSETTTSYLYKNNIIPLLSQCWLFIHTCVSINSIMSKDVIFYLLWYNVIRWSSHICKISSFLSFYSFLGWQSSKKCKWHTFRMSPCLICYFIVILFYIERKWLFMRNLATNLHLKSKSYCVLRTKVFLQIYTEVCRYLHWKCFKNAVLGSQEMVQCKCFFWRQTEVCLLKNL